MFLNMTIYWPCNWDLNRLSLTHSEFWKTRSFRYMDLKFRCSEICGVRVHLLEVYGVGVSLLELYGVGVYLLEVYGVRVHLLEIINF